MGSTHSPLLLSGDASHAQLKGQKPQNPFPRFHIATWMPKVTLFPDRRSDGPSDQLFVQKRKPNFAPPVCHGPIVSSQIALSQPADVKLELLDQTRVALSLESCCVTNVASEKFIGTKS